MRFPWTLRPFVKQLADRIVDDPRCSVNQFDSSIVSIGAVDLYTDWFLCRVVHPATIILSTREWWMLSKAQRKRFANRGAQDKVDDVIAALYGDDE